MSRSKTNVENISQTLKMFFGIFSLVEGPIAHCGSPRQKTPQPVANAIKLLQAYIYKSVNTGLFLTSLVATSIVKFMLLMLDR